MKWWRVVLVHGQERWIIRPSSVGEATDNDVFIPIEGTLLRCPKETDSEFYAPTFDEARAWLVKKFKEGIETYRKTIECANAAIDRYALYIAKLEAMEEPKEES